MTEPTPSDNPFAGPPPVPPITDIPDKDARTWAMLCHLAGLAGLAGASCGQVLGPLIVWLIKRGDHPFIDEQGKEALNFQISVTLYTIVGSILLALPIVTIPFAWLFAIGMVVFGVVYAVIGGIAANQGQHFRYPITIRFIK
jgi:uncharacterized Tic20 family protein